MPESFNERVLRHLTEVSRGELTLTVDDVLEVDDEALQRILYGIVYLHEELVYREESTTARVRAEAADRAKTAFLTTMSHELRTPLNAIIGYADMVVEEVEDGVELDQTSLVEDLGRIRDAGRHLLALVNDMLDLARVEAGQLTTQVTDVDVGALLQEVARTVEPAASSKGVVVRVRADMARVHTDRRLLLQCLINLAMNAVKFTEAGYVQLEVTVAERGVVIAVEDSGRGMSDQELSQVFSAFEQVHQGEQGGVGLGLSITQRLVDHLGIEMSVKSAPGEGTRFELRVPRA